MNIQNQHHLWRRFQSELQQESKNRIKARKRRKLFFVLCLVIALTFGIRKLNFFPFSGVNEVKTCSDDLGSLTTSFFSCAGNTVKAITGIIKADDTREKKKNITDKKEITLTKNELKELINVHLPVNSEKTDLTLNINNRIIAVDTSLDLRLQHFVISKLERLKTLDRGKPEIIGIVTMEPASGKILTMAGFDQSSPHINPCTQGEYPAASIFKIITASAAVEKCGYGPETLFYFNGGQYTLYKRQLQERKNNNTNQISFENAFAKSINPVFGKLGANTLQGTVLKKYAQAFGFNQPIDSDFTFKPATTEITQKPYQWAEIASGFNKTTRISPMFGAMLTSTILNSGKTPLPYLVESVTDENGNLIYRKKNEIIRCAVKAKTAKTVMKLMNKTISLGTAKKCFRGFKKDAVLSKLDIGGKTGSLYNRDHTVKFDWFTGFAREKKGDRQIVVSVVVGHGKYIGTKAGTFGKMIIKEYFNNYFASCSRLPNNS